MRFKNTEQESGFTMGVAEVLAWWPETSVKAAISYILVTWCIANREGSETMRRFCMDIAAISDKFMEMAEDPEV